MSADSSTISTCRPSGQIGIADESFSLPSIPSAASRMVQKGLFLDVIVTVLEVTGRGRGHVPTPSASLSKRSLLWRNFGSSCGVNSFSNRFSSLPTVVFIGSLYSLGCFNIVYYRYRCPGFSNVSRLWRLMVTLLSIGWSDRLATIREARNTSC